MVSSGCIVEVKAGDTPVVVISGEIDYQSAQQIREVFEQLNQDGVVNLSLDCSAVDFVDSSGIGAIVYAAYAMQKKGGGVRLIAGTRQFVHALQVSGFAKLLHCEATSSALNKQPSPRIPVPGFHQRASFSIPCQADTDGEIRRRVTDLAKALPFTEEQIDDIRLAVGEAVSNAVRYGCWGDECSTINVRCVGDNERLVVEISNPGPPFNPDNVPVPNPELMREGGMGIFFMKASMDSVEYSFDEKGTTVKMSKYIPARA
jgi:anti-anti-sigma factor